LTISHKPLMEITVFAVMHIDDSLGSIYQPVPSIAITMTQHTFNHYDVENVTDNNVASRLRHPY